MFVPQQKIIAATKLEPLFLIEPPLYHREHEVIQSELLTLRYLVRIRVITAQDWNTPPSSDEDDSLGDSDNNNDPDWLNRGNRGRSGPWLRKYWFGNNGGGQNSSSLSDP